MKPTPVASYTHSGSGLSYNFNSSGSSGDVTRWEWNFGDGSFSNEPNPSHSFAQKDTFHICLTVYNGSNCSFTLCKDVNLLTGVKSVEAKKYAVLIYPNPATGSVNIDVNGTVTEDYELTVMNVYGQQVRQLKGKTGTTVRMDTYDLPQGIFIYGVRIKGVTATQGKIIINK